MRALLLFLSSIFMFAAHGVCVEPLVADSTTSSDSRRYAFSIETPKSALSGVMLTKQKNGYIIGSMVNEFGISAIDFSFDIDKDKLKLINVVGFLDKWYIKRTIKEDIKFCLHRLYDIPDRNTKHRYQIQQDGDTLSVSNAKRNLKYTFSTFIPTDGYDTEE